MQPKKPKKPRAKKINIGARHQWESILKSVNKDEVPVEMLEAMTVNLIDDTKISINIKELIGKGLDPKEIERQINNQLKKLDNMVVDVDFFICIDSVADTIGPITNELLKDI